jgi:hypothetical protein
MMKPFKIDGILCVPTLIHYESKPAPPSNLFAKNCTSLLERLQVDLALDSEKGLLGSDEGRGARAIPRATGTWYSKSDTGFDGEEQSSEWKFCVQSHVHRDYNQLSQWFRANHKSIVLHCAGKMSSDPNETHAQATRTVNSISGRLLMGSTEESQHSSHPRTSKQTSTVSTRRPRRPALRSRDSGGSVNSTRTVRFEGD